MRNLLFAVILLLAVYLGISQFTEIEQVVETLQRGDWRWLLAAAGVQLAVTVNAAASLRAIYRALGVEERIEDLLPLVSAAHFLNIVAPMGGVSGMAVLIADARRRRRPVGRASTAAALLVLYDYAAFLVVLALGLIVLFRRNQLDAGEIVASAILLAIACGIGTLVYLGMRSADQLGAALAWLGARVNAVLRPLIKREYLNLERAHAFARDAAQGLQEARRRPETLLLPGALALSSKALLISILFLVFMAFRQPFSVGTLIAGFSIGYLFLIVSPTPSGIGFVEGILTLTLVSLRVPLAPAALIALAYRGITLWLPLAYGGLALRWAGRSAPPD
jgi:glycosyltransferase 2 family protein